MRRLPPLESLRVFEAAARHLSFKGAGDELSVTASAVSHRIAALEEELGTPLFVRRVRRIELTADGERLAAGMRRALGEIRRAVASVDRGVGLRLRITAIPSQVTRWLAPRLNRFHAAHPDIELEVVADLELADLTQGAFEVALRFGAGDYPGLHVEHLMDDVLVAIASPRFLSEHGPVTRPGDLTRLTRIIDATSENDDSGVNWRTWLAHHRLPTGEAGRGMRFNGAALVIEAAAGGLGVALTRKSLVVGELQVGRLALVPGEEIATNWRHFAVTAPALAEEGTVRAFIDWLHAEAASG
jgi:LysR family glycine cleavage system transcriptional activator